MHRSSSGQATADYVAVLTLLALTLGVVGTAVAAPGLPRAVYNKLRLALCIVGGDVCRDSDALARGLPPCVVSGNGGSSQKGVTIGIVRFGHGGSDMIERRSDGTLRITRSKVNDLSGTLGLEVSAGPYLKLGASGTMGAGYAPGEVWEIDADAFKKLVERAGPSASRDEIFDLLPPPVETFHELSPHAAAQFTAALAAGDDVGASLPGAGTSERRELGMREERDGTRTYYYALHDPEGTGLLAGVAGGGDTIVEWRATEPPELTLRIGRPAGEDGSEEFIGRLTLADPAVRDAARRAVLLGGVLGANALRTLATAISERGTVERHRFAVEQEHGDTDVGVKIGVGLGYDKSRDWVVKRLVDAEVLGGPFPVKREDCLPRDADGRS
jgi:hypothetical protein